MTIDHLREHSEESWVVFGPCSGGIRVVYFCDGRLYTFSDGDAVDRGSCGIVERTVEEYANSTADDAVMGWLKRTGRGAGADSRS